MADIDTCDACGGSGDILDLVSRGDSYEPESVPCRKCRGLGYKINDPSGIIKQLNSIIDEANNG